MKVDIKVLRDLIEEKGYLWEVRKNRMTELDSKIRIKMLGAIVPFEIENNLSSIDEVVNIGVLPTEIDWRDNNGNFVSSVKNQGNCGSCVAFGSTAVFESMIAIENQSNLYDLSEADSFFCSSHGTTCNGWWPSSFYNANMNRGIIPETLFTYQQAFGDGPICLILPNRLSYTFTYAKTSNVFSIEATKQYLVNFGPITGCFDVYEDFYAYKSGIYKHVSGNFEGSHCICIVGYNDNNGNGYWICKNSWGDNWGLNGYFNIAYNDCKIDTYSKSGVTGTTIKPVINNNLFLTTLGNDGIFSYKTFEDNNPKQIPPTSNYGFRGIIMINNTFYLTTQGNDGIFQYQENSPNAPTQIKSTTGYGFNGIINIDNTLYVTAQGSDGIYQYEIGSANAPMQIAPTAGYGFKAIIMVGNTFYMTTQGDDGIYMYEQGSNNAPIQIPSTAGFGFNEIIKVGNTFYLTAQGSDGIYQYKEGSDSEPKQIATTAGYGFNGIVALDNNTLLLTTQGSDGIYIYIIGSNNTLMQLPYTDNLGFRSLFLIKK